MFFISLLLLLLLFAFATRLVAGYSCLVYFCCCCPCGYSLSLRNLLSSYCTLFNPSHDCRSNNIALKAAVSEGDGPGLNYIVTSVWDWAPLASWDGGAHWPSWQIPADGTSGSCIGEGGGAYGMGRSNHMLLMHHHNILCVAPVPSFINGDERGPALGSAVVVLIVTPAVCRRTVLTQVWCSHAKQALVLRRKESVSFRRPARRYRLRPDVLGQGRLVRLTRARRSRLRPAFHGPASLDDRAQQGRGVRGR